MSGYKYSYFKDFSYKHIYDVDYQAYKNFIDKVVVDSGLKDTDPVIGCGACSWTEKSRYTTLMQCYEDADIAGNKDGQISYEECVVGETNCMIQELSEEGSYHSVVESCGNENSVEAAASNAETICNDYEIPDENSKKLDERKQAAEDLYNAMKKS